MLDNAINELQSLDNLVSISEAKSKKAIERALNDTMKSLRHSVVVEASQAAEVQLKLLRNRSKLIKATLKSLEGGVSILVYSIPAILAKAKQNKYGVSTSAGSFKSAFIAMTKRKTMPRRVMRRKYLDKHFPEHPGYPLQEMRIPIEREVDLSVAQNETEVDEKFIKNLTRHFKLAGGLI